MERGKNGGYERQHEWRDGVKEEGRRNRCVGGGGRGMWKRGTSVDEDQVVGD